MANTVVNWETEAFVAIEVEAFTGETEEALAARVLTVLRDAGIRIKASTSGDHVCSFIYDA